MIKLFKYFKQLLLCIAVFTAIDCCSIIASELSASDAQDTLGEIRLANTVPFVYDQNEELLDKDKINEELKKIGFEILFKFGVSVSISLALFFLLGIRPDISIEAGFLISLCILPDFFVHPT